MCRNSNLTDVDCQDNETMKESMTMTVKLITSNSIAYLAEFNISRQGDSLFAVNTVKQPKAQLNDFMTLVSALLPGWNERHPIDIRPIPSGMNVEKIASDSLNETEVFFRSLFDNGDSHAITYSDKEKGIDITVNRDEFLTWLTSTNAEPKFIGVSGYRRSMALLFVNYLASVNDKVSPITKVSSVQVDQATWMLHNIQENEKRNFGVRDTSTKSKCLAGIALLQRDPLTKQVIFRDLFFPGVGQKAYAIATADLRYPDLTIRDKIVSGDLDVGPIVEKALRDAIPQGREQVLKALEGRKPANAKKIMAKTDIETLSANHPNPWIRIAMKTILDNDVTLSGFDKIVHQEYLVYVKTLDKVTEQEPVNA